MLTRGTVAPPLAGLDHTGAPLDLGGRTYLLAFLRPVESPLGRLALLELDQARADLGALGCEVVAVVPSTPEQLRAFTQARGLKVRALPDPEGATGRAFQMGRDPLGLMTLRGLLDHDVSLRRTLRALRLGGGLRHLAQPALPAELLIDATDRIRWLRLGCSRLAGPDLDAVRQALRPA